MILRVRTETGSLYVLDTDKLLWMRYESTEQSGKLRTEAGNYREARNVEVGARMELWMDPLPSSAPETTVRIVQTSTVMCIEEIKVPVPKL